MGVDRLSRQQMSGRSSKDESTVASLQFIAVRMTRLFVDVALSVSQPLVLSYGSCLRVLVCSELRLARGGREMKRQLLAVYQGKYERRQR